MSTVDAWVSIAQVLCTVGMSLRMYVVIHNKSLTLSWQHLNLCIFTRRSLNSPWRRSYFPSFHNHGSLLRCIEAITLRSARTRMAIHCDEPTKCALCTLCITYKEMLSADPIIWRANHRGASLSCSRVHKTLLETSTQFISHLAIKGHTVRKQP